MDMLYSIISGGSQERRPEAQKPAVCQQCRQQFQQLIPRLPQPGLWQRQQHQHRDKLHHNGREHPGIGHHHAATVVGVGHQQAEEPLGGSVGQRWGRKWKCKSSHTPTPGDRCVFVLSQNDCLSEGQCVFTFSNFFLSLQSWHELPLWNTVVY